MPSLLTRGMRRVRRALWPTPHERSYRRWVADDGDETRRFAYRLEPGALVFDVGGYEGTWAEGALERFGCTVHVFEPVPEYASGVAARLAGTRAVVHPYGLAGRTREEDFVVAGDGSSALRREGRHVRVSLRGASETFAEVAPGGVALLKVNIEGGEYELLEHLLEHDLMRRVQYLQVQFHDFVPAAARRMRAIQARLAETHTLEWQYVFIWESWARRPTAG